MNERNASESNGTAHDEPRPADSYDLFRGLQEAPRIIDALTFDKLTVVMAYVALLVIGAVSAKHGLEWAVVAVALITVLLTVVLCVLGRDQDAKIGKKRRHAPTESGADGRSPRSARRVEGRDGGGQHDGSHPPIPGPARLRLEDEETKGSRAVLPSAQRPDGPQS